MRVIIIGARARQSVEATPTLCLVQRCSSCGLGRINVVEYSSRAVFFVFLSSKENNEFSITQYTRSKLLP